MKKVIKEILSNLKIYYIISVILTVIFHDIPFTKNYLMKIYDNYYSVLGGAIGNHGIWNKAGVVLFLLTTFPIIVCIAIIMIWLALYLLLSIPVSSDRSFDLKKANEQYIYAQGLKRQQNRINKEINDFLRK